MAEAKRHTRLILASASPRRRDLLEQVGLSVECSPVNIDETPLIDETPEQLVCRLSCNKAEECLRRFGSAASHEVFLGADTVIDLDGVALGKPRNKNHAIEMLQMLAGREHEVRTGVSLRTAVPESHYSCVVNTTVRFGTISRAQASLYWASGEPEGKAGGYAIQGSGAQFVAHLSGSYSNVVGLPLYETVELLRMAAPALLQLPSDKAVTDVNAT